MFVGISIDGTVPPLLAIDLSTFAVFVFFAADGRKTCWRQCHICSLWFERRDTTKEPPLIARFALGRTVLCPHCAEAKERVLEENETLSLSE